MALACAFSDPLVGGSVYETNTDLKVPLSSHLNRDDSPEDRRHKFAFLSEEEQLLDGDAVRVKSDTKLSAQERLELGMSPRPRAQSRDDVGSVTDGMGKLTLTRETTEVSVGGQSSDEYDTDIEDSETTKTRIEMHKDVGKDTYLWACDDAGTTPITAVLRNLDKPDFSLSGRNMGTKAAIALATPLKKNSRIVNLNLSDNGMGPEGGAHITATVAENETIVNLNLSQNKMGVLGALGLGEMIKKNKTIKHLDISRNEFDAEAAHFIARGLELNERLEDVDLSFNCLCEIGGLAIGKALEKNDSIVKLNISHNHIRRSGGVTILKALHTNYVLHSLDISWNGLGYEGSLALSEMLKVNSYLIELDVRNCRIDWKGAQFIAEGLKRNEALELIKLSGNPITTTGTMDIVEAVGHRNSAMKFLDLSDVLVIYEFEMMAKAVQQTRPDFRYVHGGIVNSHDILGQRLERRIEPMQRVMNYMKERELRPTELFRSFDKAVKSKLTKEQFAKRIQSSGIPVASYEIDELLETLTGTHEGASINYQNLAESVSTYIEKERRTKIRERENQKKTEELHAKILNPALFNPILPPIMDDAFFNESGSQLNAAGSMSALFNSMAGINSVTSMGGGSNTELTRSQVAPPPGKPTKLLSMSTSLGAKAKAFGSLGTKKTKKKTKKKGRSKKKKR